MNKHKILIGLLWFASFAAILGGVGLIMGKMGLPAQWLEPTGFKTYYFPGVILMAVVGGSALIAAVSQHKKLIGANLATVVSGIIMMFWVVGEIASIGKVNFLQALFFGIGLSIVLLTPSEEKSSTKTK